MKPKAALFLTFFLVTCMTVCLFCPVAEAAPKKPKPKLNIKKLEMTVGSDFVLRVYNLKKKQTVSFSTDNENIVSIESTVNGGKHACIRAQSIGKARIFARIYKGTKMIRMLKCKINVSPSGVSIKFLRPSIRMAVNERFRLEPVIKPNTSTEQPIYESAAPAIATVNSHGVITAVSPGTTTITATLLFSDVSAVCTVTVTDSGYPVKTPRYQNNAESAD